MRFLGSCRQRWPWAASAALAMALGLAMTGVTVAQEQQTGATKTAEEAKAIGTKASPTAAQAQPAGQSRPALTTAQQPTAQNPNLMGPPAPPQAGQPGNYQAVDPRKAAGVPDPTVVLKPGEVPGIQFDTPTYDFGRIKAGPEVSHDFWFTNTGTGPLEILKVRPG